MLNIVISKQNSGIASQFIFQSYPIEILNANSLSQAAFRNTKFLSGRNIQIQCINRIHAFPET